MEEGAWPRSVSEASNISCNSLMRRRQERNELQRMSPHSRGEQRDTEEGGMRCVNDSGKGIAVGVLSLSSCFAPPDVQLWRFAFQ